MAPMERILIADDHPLVRGALALSLEAAFGRIDILECASSPNSSSSSEGLTLRISLCSIS
jgi:DNA-binding NarL/FixJ family response regulator